MLDVFDEFFWRGMDVFFLVRFAVDVVLFAKPEDEDDDDNEQKDVRAEKDDEVWRECCCRDLELRGGLLLSDLADAVLHCAELGED